MRNKPFVRGVVLGLALGASSVLSFRAWAVFTSSMTTDQLGSHLIRLLNRGFAQGIFSQEEQKAFCRLFYKAAVDYINNGTFDTQANRKIAVRDMVRLLYQTMTGKDPTSGTVAQGPASQRHDYIRHFLKDAEIQVSTATIQAVEDEN